MWAPMENLAEAHASHWVGKAGPFYKPLENQQVEHLPVILSVQQCQGKSLGRYATYRGASAPPCRGRVLPAPMGSNLRSRRAGVNLSSGSENRAANVGLVSRYTVNYGR
jgi:hypothetical protein